MSDEISKSLIIRLMREIKTEILLKLWNEFTPTIVDFQGKDTFLYIHRPRGPESDSFVATVDQFSSRSGPGVTFKIRKGEIGLPD